MAIATDSDDEPDDERQNGHLKRDFLNQFTNPKIVDLPALHAAISKPENREQLIKEVRVAADELAHARPDLISPEECRKLADEAIEKLFGRQERSSGK